MSAPKPGFPPAWTAYGGVRVLAGTIISVNKVKWTCTVNCGKGEHYEDVPVMPGFVGAEGQGEFKMPETNSPVWVCKPSQEGKVFVLGGAALPTQMDEGDAYEDPTDYRMNRPVLGEGDQGMMGPGGSPHVILRKGGMLELGADQACRSWYFPLKGLLQHFCQRYELYGAAGSWEYGARLEDQSHGTARTPVEFNLQLKEFAQDDPIIQLGLGRIADEDDQRLFHGTTGDIVARLIINNRYRFWVDKAGNVQSYVHGGVVRSHNGPVVEYYHSTLMREVKELFRQRLGKRAVEVSGNDALEVTGDRTVRVGGNVSEEVTGTVARQLGGVADEVRGSVERKVQGSLSDEVGGSVSQSVGGTHEMSVQGGASELVGGKKVTKVLNSQADGNGYEIYVYSGKLEIHDALGNVELSSGGGSDPAAALARVTITPAGAIQLSSSGGLATVEVNSSGIQISTAGGVIELDQAGLVLLGGAVPPRGAVVTTLTHPVDLVTGTPILGSATVAAGGIASPAAVPATSFASAFLV